MKFIWHVKSRVYHMLRCLPGLRIIINQEKENLKHLIPQSVAACALILDLGTGAGSSLDIFPFEVPIVAVDQSLTMLKQARKLRNRLMPVVADASVLPFRTNSVPFCSCIGITEYLSDLPSFLTEIHRVIRDPGTVLITGARPGPLNGLRLLLGHRLYLRSPKCESHVFRQAHFVVEDTRSSLLQTQWLLTNHNSHNITKK